MTPRKPTPKNTPKLPFLDALFEERTTSEEEFFLQTLPQPTQSVSFSENLQRFMQLVMYRVSKLSPEEQQQFRELVMQTPYEAPTLTLFSYTGEETPPVVAENQTLYGKFSDLLGKFVQQSLPKMLFRASGHFVDQKLNALKQVPTKSKKKEPKNLPTSSDFKLVEKDYLGSIVLTPHEDKLLRTILSLLHLNSSLDIEHESYYTGNAPDIQLQASDNFQRSVAALRIKPIDLYKSYTNKAAKDISGKEIENVRNILHKLATRNVQITYKRIIKKIVKGKETEVVQRIETDSPLLRIIKFYELSKAEDSKLDKGDKEIAQKREELLLAINPVFIDQIKTKYVEYPFDITQRIETAAGGLHKVTQAMNLLVDYLLREKSSKRYECEIRYDNLVVTLGLSEKMKKDKKRAIASIERAIEVCKHIELLHDAQISQGIQGDVLNFRINEHFK